MRRKVSLAEFKRLAKSGASIADLEVSDGLGAAITGTEDRMVTAILSTGAVARDDCTIAVDGWDYAGYLKYGTVLRDHDMSKPVARMQTIWKSSGVIPGQKALVGSFRFPAPGISADADATYGLIKEGVLNSVSVSWRPKSWRYSTDKGRNGGIDFLQQELLEVSVVTVPADTNALITARSELRKGVPQAARDRVRTILAERTPDTRAARVDQALRLGEAIRASDVEFDADLADTPQARGARVAEALRLAGKSSSRTAWGK